jgi:superfamily I DNA and/or RNA helicase
MQNKSLALVYFDELLDIHSDTLLSLNEKYKKLTELLEKITKEVVKKEVVNFSNLFSRLTFIVDKFNTKRNIQKFRYIAHKINTEKREVSIEEYETHFKHFAEFIAKVFNISIPLGVQYNFPEIEFIEIFEKKVKTEQAELRVEIVDIKDDYLVCDFEENTEEELIIVSINNLEYNSPFNNINSFWKGAELNLVNVDIDEKGIYYPKFIILEPNYLIDISAIAECFQDYGTSELNYIKSKFEEAPNSKFIRLGNFANLVMDKLFGKDQNEIIKFIDVLKEDFKQSPIEYASCADIDTTENMQQYVSNAELQFTNIKRVVENDFIKPEINIDIKTATLEPAFLNSRYGIQGRLDVLELKPKNKGISKIIELKSGGTPFPDDGKSMKPNHAVQLYLYYQLIGVINTLDFKDISKNTDGHILYSKVATNNIRSDKPYLKRVQQILNLRNRIILNEFLLASDNINVTKELIENIIPDNIITNIVNPNFRVILEPQILNVKNTLAKCTDLEQTYFYSFAGFIAKEQYLSKLGNNLYDSNNGLSNLWLSEFKDKADKFEILFDLKIKENNTKIVPTEIIFERSNQENKFVNFRKGDICILYPRNHEDDIATKHQIFKCTIKSISTKEVTVAFRYKQNNTNYFDNFEFWALERDFMDASFATMYRNLFAFINSKQHNKNLLLNIDLPKKGNDYGYYNEHLSKEQNRIINNALSANDYFLLNGPPGTGKTSIIIKELVKEIYKNNEAKILLLAYTNRAVNELCEAITNALIEFKIEKNIIETDLNSIDFVRIGSELSCDEKYKENLLVNVCEKVTNRDQVKALLSSKRIYISTVASISSKLELFNLIKFDTLIVDEASQILEPQIIGVLPKCNKFILIGDHKQLPAIVLQTPESSQTNNNDLENIGLHNRKNSLFERLYKYCEVNNLNYAYDILTYQGRMHKEIALFPNYNFYNSLLNQAYDIPNLSQKSKDDLERQVIKLNLKTTTKNTLEDLLSKKRVVFFPSKIDYKNHFGKLNEYEADLVIKIVNKVIDIYKHNNMFFDNKKTIGIIATYRNQIALIKKKLEEANIPNYEDITVDTVERYQGSQRDIIILTFAVNNPYQLNGIINLNDEGNVDRKLNVALTRAKEQLIIIGNDDILSNNLIYYKLIEFIKSQGGYVWDKIEDVINDKLHYDYFDEKQSIEGKTFTPDDVFKTIFDDIIINPLKNDERTKEYPKLILGQTNDFIRNNIIEFGRTNFDKIYEYQSNLFSQEFSIKDKVMLYCYYNMRKHYFSNLAVFDTYKDLLDIELKQVSNRVSFIDFGCGPLTAGIAFNQFAKKTNANFSMNYWGIDISNGMLNMAKEFSKSAIFNTNSTFKFLYSLEELENPEINEVFRLSNLVILNFSYLFANLDLEQTLFLANQINNLEEKYPLNKFVIIYQNPVNKHHNFSRFKKAINNINNVIVRNSETVSYKNNSNSWYDNSETFTYEIITN